MIEYTYFEIFLMCAFFVLLALVIKYREEKHHAFKIIRHLLDEPRAYEQMKNQHDKFMKEMRNAD